MLPAFRKDVHLTHLTFVCILNILPFLAFSVAFRKKTVPQDRNSRFQAILLNSLTECTLRDNAHKIELRQAFVSPATRH